MVKTTGGVSQPCAKIEIDIDCDGTFTDYSGQTNTANLPMEVKTHGSIPVFGGRTHVISSGKVEPVEVGLTFVYTETASEIWEDLRAEWLASDCELPVCARITPGGGTVGDKEILVGTASDKALLVGLKPPDFDAGAGEPAVGEMMLYGNYDYDTKAS